MLTKKKVRSLQALLLVAVIVTGLVAAAVADDRTPAPPRPRAEVDVTVTPVSGSTCGLRVVIDGGEPFAEYRYVRRGPVEFTDHQYFLERRSGSGWEPVRRNGRLVLSQFIVDGQEVIFHPTTNAPVYPDQEWSVGADTFRWSHHTSETNVYEVTSYERSPVPLDLGDGWSLDSQRTVSADPHQARVLVNGEPRATRTWWFGTSGHDHTITSLDPSDAYEVQLRVGDPLTHVVPDEWATFASGTVDCDEGPERQVVAGAWEATSFDCVRGVYAESRTITTIDHRWDAGQGAWVPRELTHEEDRLRTATAEEMVAEGCQFQPEVTGRTPWTHTAEPECGDRVVEQSRTVTSTPFVWHEQVGRWVHDPSGATDEVERREVELSLSQRRAACGEQPAATWSYGAWVEEDITCGATEVARTRDATLTPYVFDDEAAAWVEDVANAMTRQETATREVTSDESKATCPPLPDPTVVQTEWVDGAWSCGDTELTQARTVTTTPHVWSALLGRYIEDTSNASTVEETRPRPLTDAELVDCASEPEPTVQVGPWVDGDWGCGDREVTQIRTVTTTPFVWDDGTDTWVEDEASVAEVEESRTRGLTDAESQAPCPAQPDDVVEAGPWQDHGWACEDTTTLRSRDVIRTPHRWDAHDAAWVLDAAASVSDVEVAARDLTDAESQEPCEPTVDSDEDDTGGTGTVDGGGADETEGAPDGDGAPEVLAGSRDATAAHGDEPVTVSEELVVPGVGAESATPDDGDAEEARALAPDADGGTGAGPALPRTGANVLTLLVLGLAALCAGIAGIGRARGRSGTA